MNTLITKEEPLNQRAYAICAGLSLLLMAIVAAFSYGFVHGSLVISDDASRTIDNLMASSTLFKVEILGWLVILICDIVGAWAIYLYMKPIHKNLSLLGAWLRLIYAAILGIAILNLLYVSLLTNSADYSALIASGDVQTAAMFNLEAFEAIWSIGLIIFGGHLLVIGIVALRASHIPNLIGYLLLAAAIGYLLTHIGSSLLHARHHVIVGMEMVLMVPMAVGELAFALWLLFKGGKQAQKS